MATLSSPWKCHLWELKKNNKETSTRKNKEIWDLNKHLSIVYAGHNRANGSANKLAHHTKIKGENKLYHRISRGGPPKNLCKNMNMTPQKFQKPPRPSLKIWKYPTWLSQKFKKNSVTPPKNLKNPLISSNFGKRNP